MSFIDKSPCNVELQQFNSWIVPLSSLSLCSYCWCCSSATLGIGDLTLWGLVKPLSCWWGAVCMFACMCVCVQTVCASLDVGMSTLQRPVKCCLNEVPVQQWWVVFDGHVICLFSPNGLFSWLREGERGRQRKRNQERGRADRFTPSPLLAPPMSHLILLPTAKSTPLTHSWLVRTTTADCLRLYLTVCLGGISVADSVCEFFF